MASNITQADSTDVDRSFGLAETTLIVLSAPSVKNRYYKSIFPQIIDYMSNFINLVQGKDEAVILVDSQTWHYFDGKVPKNVRILANIEDIWIRDFAPVIPSEQVKFRYNPDYLRNSVARSVDKSFLQWLSKNALNVKQSSNIVLDGGNVVDNPNGTRVILTDRILKDNPRLSKIEAKNQLKNLLNVEQVAIIPEMKGDTTGHADGVVMWSNDNKILFQEVAEPERSRILDELRTSFPGVNIVEIPDYYQHRTWKGFTSACNIFVNSIVTDRFIYVPTFNGPHDQSTISLIQTHTSKQVVSIPAEKVCFMGGSVRCLSWQVKGSLKKRILELVHG